MHLSIKLLRSRESSYKSVVLLSVAHTEAIMKFWSDEVNHLSVNHALKTTTGGDASTITLKVWLWWLDSFQIDPILCVPSTYLINNDGIPSDIIPSMISDEELTKRLSDGLQVTFLIFFLVNISLFEYLFYSTLDMHYTILTFCLLYKINNCEFFDYEVIIWFST